MPERGTMLGNRGGKFHRDDRTLGKRRWASHHWICCELHYRNMHHEAMGKGYTSLFFLDEVTALAAGHRPCFFCRRKEARHFVELSGLSTEALDRRLHEERINRPAGQSVEVDCLPDGAMVEHEGQIFAWRKQKLLPWSFAGYGKPSEIRTISHGNLLTPATILAILRAGYQPRWHETAQQWG